MSSKPNQLTSSMMEAQDRRMHSRVGESPQVQAAHERSATVRLLEERRNELLEQLRPMAPELVAKLERTLEALKEQRAERGEYDGLDRAGVIRLYLQKVGRPATLREIRDAVAAPASRFPGRSIWDGAKREVEHGRLVNLADASKGEDWILALPGLPEA